MKGDKLRASILGIRLISNLSSDLAKGMGIDSKYKCIGIITADSDDVLYTALDEATKASEVDVLYAKSFYGGASNASTKTVTSASIATKRQKPCDPHIGETFTVYKLA